MGMRSPSWSADGDGRNRRRVYLRTAPAERLPPPAARAGMLGWLRANLFSSPGNIALTLVCVAFHRLGGAAIAAVFRVRRGVVGLRPRGLPRHAATSATGRLLGLRARLVFLFRLRLLSDRPALARGSVFHGAGIRYRLAGLAVGAAPRHRRGLFLRRAADPVLCPAQRRAAARPRERADLAVGRHTRDHRRGDGRHRGLACRSAFCWRWDAAPIFRW